MEAQVVCKTCYAEMLTIVVESICNCYYRPNKKKALQMLYRKHSKVLLWNLCWNLHHRPLLCYLLHVCY